MLTTNIGLRIRISDMGLAKKLEQDRHSFSSTSVGSVGWQAPELMRGERQTRLVDSFSLGCLIYYILTRGKHPFGPKYVSLRDVAV